MELVGLHCCTAASLNRKTAIVEGLPLCDRFFASVDIRLNRVGNLVILRGCMHALHAQTDSENTITTFLSKSGRHIGAVQPISGPLNKCWLNRANRSFLGMKLVGLQRWSGRLSQWDICNITAARMPRVTAGTTAHHGEGRYFLGPLRNKSKFFLSFSTFGVAFAGRKTSTSQEI